MTQNIKKSKICNDGGFAFPRNTNGMTLRDYFAAHALQGLLANASLVEGMSAIFKGDYAACHACHALTSYKLADEMIKERDQIYKVKSEQSPND